MWQIGRNKWEVEEENRENETLIEKNEDITRTKQTVYKVGHRLNKHNSIHCMYRVRSV